MTTPKVLSKEELEARIARLRRSFASFGNEFAGLLSLALSEVEAHISALEKERVCALADNAALLEDSRSGLHAEHASCPTTNHDPAACDMTKCREWVERLAQPHPGVALHEERCKLERLLNEAAETLRMMRESRPGDMVRARNEGREQAAIQLLLRASSLRSEQRYAEAEAVEADAERIRALKEKET